MNPTGPIPVGFFVINSNMKKTSCVMTTYRRFTCVERSVACFLGQDYENAELIIYNTDDDHPIHLDSTFDDVRHKIKVINNNIDMETKQPYKNVGPIRRDARVFADGEYFITWDDDDLFFPWNIRQCMDGVTRTNKKAWKPNHSFQKQFGHKPVMKYNYFEASVLVEMQAVQSLGYNLDITGGEHMKWFKALTAENQLMSDTNSVPGYCFYWSDPPDVAGHKQSAVTEYERLDNFERHKLMTKDIANRALTRKSLMDYQDTFEPFSELIKQLFETKPELCDKYISNHKNLFLL